MKKKQKNDYNANIVKIMKETESKRLIPFQFKPDVVIGIDPDNKESGVGIVWRETKRVEAFKFSFPKLVDYLRETKNLGQSILIVVEGGWLNESNWHIKAATKYVRDPLARAASIGRSTGMNAQTGILIAEMCDHLEIPCTIQKPLKKCWRGADGKITQIELQAIVGRGQKLPRMNQDERDALLLAWVYADLPVKVSSNVK